MGATLSLTELRRRAGKFATRWKGTTQENANTQLFWAEFMGIFGIDPKRVVLFEHNADRLSTGNRGRIDVFWPGELLIEQKSTGQDLEKATDQAYDYLQGLNDREFPKSVVISDFQTFRVHDMTASPIQVETFSLAELQQHIELFAWIAGYSRRRTVSAREQEANARAVKKMGTLYEALTADGYLSDHHISVLLTRLLFLMFSEDTGLVERGLFSQLVRDRGGEDGSHLGGVLGQLFQTLDRPVDQRSARTDELILQFPYVNGGLFSETLPLVTFDSSMRDALIAATDFEWGSISPAIFGSMFQAVKSKELRRELGEHYTTERDILKTLGPLFLDELQEEFDSCQHSVQRLKKLRTRLGKLTFLDPACGCGNFLIITYRELRDLELRIITRLQDLTGDNQLSLDASLGLQVHLGNYYGIEIEEWPARIAETAMFMVDHQANRRMIETVGQAPDRLPIEETATIVTANSLQLNWSNVVEPSDDLVIVGNPPFVGISLRSEGQTADLKSVWGDGYHGSLDFVTGWYKKAADFVGRNNARIGFVSTSSVSQGEQVAPLWAPLLERGFTLDFAHRTFGWTSEASGRAAVHVVIIGFSRRTGKRDRRLFFYPDVKGEPVERLVKNITPYLTEGPSIVVSPQTKPLSPSITEVRYGNKPTDGGFLIVEPDDYDEFAADPAAAKYLRPYVGARELLHDTDRWCLWLTELDAADYKASSLLRDRIGNVRKFRAASKAASTREFAVMARLFRQISQPETAYLCIPRHVSEARLYFTAKSLTPDIVTGDANFLADDPDGLLFAIISSSAFIAWQRTIGGRLESRLRFSKLGVWNTFPMPELTERQHAALITAGEGVLTARSEYSERSLADLYEPNLMPPALLKAHAELDKVMDGILAGRKKMKTEADRLAVLFDLYAQLI